MEFKLFDATERDFQYYDSVTEHFLNVFESGDKQAVIAIGENQVDLNSELVEELIRVLEIANNEWLK